MQLTDLDKFKKSGFLPGYPVNFRKFFSPVDDVHGALKMVLDSAYHSLIIAMYGYDDDELHHIILGKCINPNIYVSMALDSSQAGGKHERTLLQSDVDVISTHVVTGRSERGAIMHMKAVVVDGLWIIDGSTNWSTSGETKQDNQLTITQDAVAAAELTSRIMIIHDHMAKKMQEKNAPIT